MDEGLASYPVQGTKEERYGLFSLKRSEAEDDKRWGQELLNDGVG